MKDCHISTSSVVWLLLSLFCLSSSLLAQEASYKRFINRAGYSFSTIESRDSRDRKAITTATDLLVHAGLQMKLSPLWSSQVEVSLRHQQLQDDPHSTSFLLGGQFDLRRKIFPRFDGALIAGLKQEVFFYGNGNRELDVKKLSLPMLGLQTYVDLFRFITSGISLKLSYIRYFSAGSDEVNIKSGSAYRAGLVYLLRYRNVDWNLEFMHERSEYLGNYDQENVLNSFNLGLAYE